MAAVVSIVVVLADRGDDHHAASSSPSVGSSTLSHTWGRWYDEGTTVETRPEGFELYKTRRGCDPNLGIAYTHGGEKPTPYYPIKLFYNVAGNIAGFGITVWGQQWQNLIDKGFWIPVDNGPHYPSYEITISFRSAPCDADAADVNLPMGTQAVVNQGRDKGSISIPLDYSGIVEGMAREGQPGWDVIGSEFTGASPSYWRAEFITLQAWASTRCTAWKALQLGASCEECLRLS